MKTTISVKEDVLVAVKAAAGVKVVCQELLLLVQSESTNHLDIIAT